MRRTSFFPARFLSLQFSLVAQSAGSFKALPLAQPRDRIPAFIDDEQRIALKGNLHPLARPEFDRGAVRPDYRMERMILTLKPDPEQQQILDEFVREQHDPDSQYMRSCAGLCGKQYHKCFVAAGSRPGNHSFCFFRR